MAKKINLLVIDPQNSFCKVVDPAQQQEIHDGELCVPGAWDDMVRVANLVNRLGDKIDDISITLDCHHFLHISHPIYWVDVITGRNPDPFTTIRIENGKYIGARFNVNTFKFDDIGEFRTVRKQFDAWASYYLTQLAISGRYPHMIWPPHCLIGTPGNNIVAPLAEALLKWEKKYVARVNKFSKGSNYKVEHFSAVRAEVIDPEDAEYTGLNSSTIEVVNNADIVLLTGEARGQCLANTGRDIANTFADDSFVRKCVLLTDCTSDVTGLQHLGDDFVKEMTGRGMKLSTSTEFLA